MSAQLTSLVCIEILRVSMTHGPHSANLPTPTLGESQRLQGVMNRVLIA